MVMLQTATRVVRSASGRLIRRFTGTLAASDNVTQGTWIIVAVALAVLVVGLIAVPGSPIHGWLSNLTNSITSISA